MVKIMENPIKMYDLGVPLFLETPILENIRDEVVRFYITPNSLGFDPRNLFKRIKPLRTQRMMRTSSLSPFQRQFRTLGIPAIVPFDKSFLQSPLTKRH